MCSAVVEGLAHECLAQPHADLTLPRADLVQRHEVDEDYGPQVIAKSVAFGTLRDGFVQIALRARIANHP